MTRAKYRTSRYLMGAHHIHAADYLTTGRVLCGRKLDAQRIAATLAPSGTLAELRLHAGRSPRGLCSRCEGATERAAR